MNKELKFSELKIGLLVIDSDQWIGWIKKCDDIHNVVVEYKSGSGGYGFYCLEKSDINYYDPLYEHIEKLT